MSATADPRVGTSPEEAAGITPVAIASNSAPLMLLPSYWHWQARLQVCVLLLWLCTIWTHSMVLPRRPGWRRLLAAAPALAALIAAPFMFHPFTETILSMTITFMSVRMPVTKLLAACYGRGPLAALPLPPSLSHESPPPQRSPLAWLRQKLRRPGVPDLDLVTFFMLCPVVPRGCRTEGCGGDGGDGCSGGRKAATATAGTAGTPSSAVGDCDRYRHDCVGRDRPGDNDGHPNTTSLRRTHSAAYRARGGDRRRLLRELAGKWLAFAAATTLAVRYGSTAPLALHAALAYGMLAVMGGMMDLTALYCTAVWGVDLVPPFHNPFQATSLSDFWARRWNVTQSRVLKGLLYDPIVEGRLLPADDGGDSAGGGSGDGDGSAGGAAPESDRRAACDGHDGQAAGTDMAAALGTAILRRRRPFRRPDAREGDAVGGGHRAGGGGSGYDSDELESPREGEPTASSSSLSSSSSLPPGWGRGKAAASADLMPVGTASEAADPDSPEAPASPVTGAATAATATTGFPRHAPGGPAAAGRLRGSVAVAVPAALAATAAAAVAGCGWLALRAAASLRSPRARRAVALLVVFAFSGVEHEIFHWYVQRFCSGRWFTFFTVHGFLLLAEAAFRRRARAAAAATAAAIPAAAANTSHACSSGWGLAGACRRAGVRLAAAAWRMPPWASRLLTMAVLELTASLWFFEVLLEPGIVGRTTAALRAWAPRLPTAV